MSSYLLSAATKVRAMIIQYITRPSDLKSLYLISKELSTIATRALYYRVDLTPREKMQSEHQHNLDPILQEQIRRMKALLSKIRRTFNLLEY